MIIAGSTSTRFIAGQAARPMEIQDGTPRPGKMFLSIVVPCYNEQEGLREFHHHMTAAARALCGHRFELILIDDGSTDDTWKLISASSAKPIIFVSGYLVLPA